MILLAAHMRVPFNRPVLLDEPSSLLDVVVAGHLSGVGPRTRDVEAMLSKLGLGHTLITSSGTHALEMAALLARIEPGDEVILPSYTFVSTANAFVLRGAVLRFADNDASGNIRLDEIVRLTTPRTKVVCAVHYAGNSADMRAVVEYCNDKKLILVEDAAQAIGASCHGKPLGSFGAFSAFSFHETKNVTSGEGGALAVQTEESHKRAEILREKGTNRTQFFLGLADKYTWVDIGSSYVLSELNVAYLQPQVRQLTHINAKRGAMCATYAESLRSACGARDVTFLPTPSHNTPNHHLFALVFPSSTQRTKFIEHMRAKEVTTPFHYLSLHTSPFGVELAKRNNVPVEKLPECDRLSSCLVRLPLFYNMTEAEQAWVIENALAFLKAL